jgi:RNA polymerase sigma factor (sigma-70 family)
MALRQAWKERLDAVIATIRRPSRADCEVLTACYDDGTRMTVDDDAAALLARARDGDQGAWNRLVEQYTGLMWSVARAYRLDTATAGDAIQTTWLRLVEHLDRIQDPQRLGGWLATTVRRECLQVLRRNTRERIAPGGDAGLDAVDMEAEPLDAALLANERDAALWRAFRDIPDRCQRLLRVLIATPPPSYEQVAAALDIPIGSIGPTRARCLARLRALLEPTGLLDALPGVRAANGGAT